MQVTLWLVAICFETRKLTVASFLLQNVCDGHNRLASQKPFHILCNSFMYGFTNTLAIVSPAYFRNIAMYPLK